MSKIFEEANLVQEAITLGQEMGKYSLLALEAAKEAISKGKNATIDHHHKSGFVAEETGLAMGLDYERKLFHGTFATVREWKSRSFSIIKIFLERQVGRNECIFTKNKAYV